MTTAAEAESLKLAEPLDPLPQEMVPVLFQRINAKEEIEPRLLHQALQGSQYTLRAYAATELGKQGNASSVPYLIDALSDDSVHVGANYAEPGMATTRYRANESLKEITGQDFGFVWNDPPQLRREAIVKWRKWYTTEIYR